MENITLSENEIESLINGLTIQKVLSNGEALTISQSLMKDLVAPMINHDKKVYSKQEINNIKLTSSMQSSFRLGY